MFMQYNRLYHLERSHNMFMQYNRRESFEIVGIPSTVSTDDLEEVIDICNDAKVLANTQPLKKSDICAVHRLADQKTTVVRVVNRKFSREAIICGKNLRGNKRYGNDTKNYINNSFCPKFRFLNYVVYVAARGEKIGRRYERDLCTSRKKKTVLLLKLGMC